MSQVGAIIAAAGSPGLLYAERLLAGVKPEQFARFARPGGVMIRSNHPAFILGHLSLYPSRVMAMLGRPAGAAAYPAGHDALFKHGVECADDPGGTIYPPMAELSGLFFASHRATIAAVTEADDEVFARPNPAEGRLRELFPTIGAAANFFLGSHVHEHLGQFSAWRRAMGLPPA